MVSKLLRSSVNVLPWQFRKWIKHIPIIANLQRWFFAKFLAGQEFIHTINAGPAASLNYPIQLPDDKLIWTGTYEVEFSQALADAVNKGDICYDIGGFRAFFSGVLAVAGAKTVYIFEPFPDNCQQIQAVIAANPQLPSLHLLDIAVGEEIGCAEFSVMPEASMGKLSSSSFQQEAVEAEKISVSITTLDNLVQSGQLELPNLIKIDVEGAELSVLKGGIQTLQTCKPKLFIEIHSHELAQQCNLLLTENGYDVIVMETNKKPDFISEPEVCHFVAQ